MNPYRYKMGSLPCRKDRSRVDANGRAYAGSQRQIQTYVNERSAELSQRIIECLSLDCSANAIRWTSPLKEDGYTEYRDADFLCALGLAGYAPQLSAFWPRGGPCWDALARIEAIDGVGCILVEAKSHIKEIYGNGCGASGGSLSRIECALNLTKRWLSVKPGVCWTTRLYQSANRYAHLHFLREIAGINAYLANVYFVDDPHSRTGIEEWEPAIDNVERELGLTCPVPFSGSVFLNCLK